MESFQHWMEKIRLPAWLPLSPPVARSGFCGFCLDTQGFTIAYVSHKHHMLRLESCETILCDPKDFKVALSEWVKKNHMENVACTWLLQPETYQLFTMEALPVTPEEFQTAVRWKIKKLLSFPMDDAVIDSFPIPPANTAETKKTISVIVSQASYLNKISEQIHASGLNLTTIDIPELGLRNITSLYEQSEQSIALVSLDNESSSLMITRQQEFYFFRRFDWGLEPILDLIHDKERTNQYLDRLALEIQRSFDYFQSQWRYPAPTQILLAPMQSPRTDLVAYLTKRLAVRVTLLDLNETLNCKKPLTLTQQNQCLPLIGGVLRNEAKYDATN